MLELAKKIVEEFERNLPLLHSEQTYSDEREDVMLYLAAKAYLARYE